MRLLSTHAHWMCFVLLLAAACSGDGRRTTSDSGTDAARDATAGMDAGSDDAGTDADEAPDARGPTDGGPDAMAGDAGLSYDDEGCLTFEGASRFCGFSSDGEICAFSTECGHSSDESQCSIDCEMGVTVQCTTREDVRCVREAFESDSCSALEECAFIL